MGHTYSQHTPLENLLFKHHERKHHPSPLKRKGAHYVDMLGSVEIAELHKAWDSVGKEKVDRKELESILQMVATDEELPAACESFADFSNRLFSVFDTNKDHRVDWDEFISGMAIICEGSMDEKLQITFEAFKDGKNPYLTRAGMYALLKTAYLHAVGLLEEYEQSHRETPEDLGEVSTELQNLRKHTAERVREMVEEAFFEADTNGDQVITYDEFAAWAKSNPHVCAALNQDRVEISATLLSPEAKIANGNQILQERSRKNCK